MEKLYLKDIKHNPHDPRSERDNQHIKRLAESIKSEGLLHPIIINQDKTLVDGHYRVEALKLLGIEWLCWDKEKRTATLPRDTDFDLSIDSMAANTVLEPQSTWDKAVFLHKNIENDILKFDINDDVKTPIQYLNHVKNAFYRDGTNKFSDYEKQRIRLFQAINLHGDEYNTAIRLLEILEWPEYLQQAFKNGDIDQSKAQKWTILIKQEPKLEQRFEQILKLESKGQKIIFDTITETIKLDHEITDEQIDELIEFAKVEQETERKWTKIKVEQAVDALVHGKLVQRTQFISDKDNRMLEDYREYSSNIFTIQAEYINRFNSNIAKKEAINILWNVHNHIEQQLRELNEIKHMVVRRNE